MIEKPYLYEAEEGKKQRHKEEGNVKIEAETGLLKPQSQKKIKEYQKLEPVLP